MFMRLIEMVIICVTEKPVISHFVSHATGVRAAIT